jgi:hypothetical protein
MARLTALETILQEWGYPLNKARWLATAIDEAGVYGMGADDLAASFFRWKDRQKRVVLKKLAEHVEHDWEGGYDGVVELLLDQAFTETYSTHDVQPSLFQHTFGKA